ncbi:MAG TPA: hypothetical protein VD994_04085 [Prosthecobacter sp.]|nr:hypothetical protein [Prosthecobacter sp.]
MSLLYIVAESDRDALFYTLCAEVVTGRGYTLHSLRNRKGEGEAAVRRQMRYALQQAKSAAAAGDVYFVASIDNDRAPHPENEQRLLRTQLIRKERERRSRLEWLDETLAEKLGSDPAVWTLPLAIAIPVEMIESWIIQILEPDADQRALPFFSLADTDRARAYYGRPDPPAQCKDRCEEHQQRLAQVDREDFLVAVAVQLNPDALAARCRSFALFKEGLDGWK